MGTMEELEQHIGDRFAARSRCEHWLGVPLLRGDKVVGGIVVQSYLRTRYPRRTTRCSATSRSTSRPRWSARRRRPNWSGRVAERTDALREANRVLQQQVIERQRGEHLQAALFRIAELANTHREPGRILRGRASRRRRPALRAQLLHRAARRRSATICTFPYSVDECRHAAPAARARQAARPNTCCAPARALLADRDGIERLHRTAAKSAQFGTLSSCWLGVPLICGERTRRRAGRAELFADEHRYTLRDQELLTFVSLPHRQRARNASAHAESLKHAYAELEHRVAERTARARRWPTATCASRSRERERIERQLKHETLHDSLTGLPNRTLLLAAAGRRRWRATRAIRAELFAVLFLDLDRFKVINDSVGHLVGDDLLLRSRRPHPRLPEDRATWSRAWAATSSPCCWTDIDDTARPVLVAERIIDELQRAVPARRQGTVHLGHRSASPSPRRATASPEELLRDADVGDVPRQGRGPPSLRAVRRTPAPRRAVAAGAGKRPAPRARRATSSSRIYQPIVRLADGTRRRLRGAAALAPSRARPAGAGRLPRCRRGKRLRRAHRLADLRAGLRTGAAAR